MTPDDSSSPETHAPPTPSMPCFAADDQEAEGRFVSNRHCDPLPDVAAALLNTADLVDYVAATGMVHPFRTGPPEDKWLKPASCAIAFAGKVVYWKPAPNDEKPERVDINLQRGDRLLLERDSIVFVTLEPKFRFPDYIAGRYNLAITEIYKGLLVGTGPLVDPGFEGRLSVPIHNLTGSDHELVAGQPLVWMEFTKLSSNARWDPSARITPSPYVAFPQRKRQRKEIDDYLKAASGRPIVSSIPQSVGEARNSAHQAEQDARSIRDDANRRFRNFSIASLIAAVAIVLALVAFGTQVVAAVRDVDDRQALLERLTDLERRDAAQRDQLRDLRRLIPPQP